jgi:hypothetical protein
MGGDVPALTVHRENKPSTVEPLLTVASDKIQQEKVGLPVVADLPLPENDDYAIDDDDCTEDCGEVSNYYQQKLEELTEWADLRDSFKIIFVCLGCIQPHSYIGIGSC